MNAPRPFQPRLDHAHLSPVHWVGAAADDIALARWWWDDLAFWDEDAEVDEPGSAVEFGVNGVDHVWVLWVGVGFHGLEDDETWNGLE